MGRGLSPLQKFILRAALKKTPKRRPGWDPDTSNSWEPYLVLRPKELLVGYYGFSPKSSDYSCSKQGAREFVMSEEGEARYRAASVAIRKAFLRLEKRGLVKLFDKNREQTEFIGVTLSPAGVELAEKMA